MAMTRDDARALEQQLVASLKQMGVIEQNERQVPSRYGSVDWTVDYPKRTGWSSKARMPDAERDYGVILTTGQYASSKPPRRRKLHRDLASMLERVVNEVNARTAEVMVKRDLRNMEKAQKDFDRGWCAHRRGITCKLINGNFHALVKVGADEVWQDDVQYAASHDTLVFRSEIGKVDRWVTIETLQLLLDKGVLLDPKDVTV